MLNEITVEQFLKLDKAVAVDVRAPIEYNEGSIPGAYNLPLFSDDERAEIGTIYKQQGQDAAKWMAMEMVSPKIPALMKEIKNLIDNGFTPVIHCWRGGMRSKAVSTFMEYSGLPAFRLIGGYKEYRNYTLIRISEMLPERAIVIHGRTGVGKTEVLHHLKAKGYPILDLEGIARHRGSIFGAIGLGESHNQKTFDALLFTALTELQDSPYFIMEAESKRIGRAVQPDELLERKEKGHHFYLEASMEKRISNIVQEYVEPFSNEIWFREKVQEAITKIEKRIRSVEKQNEIRISLIEEDWTSLIRILLEDYYDPRYDHKLTEYSGSFVPINADDIEKAVALIEANLKNNKTAV